MPHKAQFLFFILFACLAAAAAVPAVSITAGPSAVDLIPGYNYTRSATVAWNVDPSMIQGLDGQVVKLFVNVSVKPDSWVDFGNGAKSVLLELECIVSNGACSDGSVLSEQVPYVLRVPASGGTNDEEFSVVPSFTPFEAPSVQPSAAQTSPVANEAPATSDLSDITGFLSMLLAPTSLVAILFTALVVTVYIHGKK
ncbi:hypothetical protein COX85_01290 [Candidatus Micrarchaeota archaeon CG_4_10_14_0_2_um_filter_55_9]|nr:MAG: hypothetical protein AUJ15_00035 [Candidatus Micrarchaeota archaeon CG1_02_55_41]PIZ91920.1 MAG: hypothetical protein COX85_01290 [Candidatus Micrarchaeota archaeon CG_4_10_14_0_2_um_filter_55_9]